MMQTGPIDRQTTTPFHLKLFYRQSSFHRLDEFPTSPPHRLPSHLEIYTWPTCTLRELSLLLMSALPDVLPSPAIGTRVSFRLVFPDTRAPEGRYTARDVGSVVIGDLNEEMENGGGSVKAGSVRLEGDAEKTLRDARFVVGDFVSCAIFPPGKDGSVMPLGVGTGGGLRGPAMRENGYGGGFRGREGGGRATFGGGARGRGGAGLSYGRLGAEEGVPNGEWRRGERVPGPETSSRGFGRGRGRDY